MNPRTIYDSLNSRVVLPVVIIAFLVGIGMYVLLSSALSSILNEKIIPNDIKALIEHKSKKIDTIFKDALLIGSFIVKNPDFIEFLKSENQANDVTLPQNLQIELGYIKEFFGLTTVYLVGTDSLNYYTSEGFLKKVDLDLGENSWFESTLNSKDGYEINIDSAMTGNLNLWYDGVMGEGDRVYGLGGFGIDISNIIKSIDDINFGNDTNVRIVDKDGIIRLSSGKAPYPNKEFDEDFTLDSASIVAIKEHIEQNSFGYGEFLATEGEKERFYIVSPLASIPLYAVVDFPRDNILQNYKPIMQIATFFPIILTFIAWIIGYLLLKTQVLNQKNRELEEAKKEAQEAALAKSNFISGVSHELRTPLNAIINFTDMMIEDFDEMIDSEDLRKDAKEYLARVLKNSKHLLMLINDILDFSKLEAGKVEYESAPFSLGEFLKTLYANTESLVGAKPINYTLELPKNEIMLSGDKRRFMQACLNLVSNAIKFTESGFVKISAKEEGNNVYIDIEDSGRGIEASMLEKIFTPFSQVNKYDKGTGLGLGIAKRYCEDMGMKISVASTLGVGSRFRIEATRFS